MQLEKLLCLQSWVNDCDKEDGWCESESTGEREHVFVITQVCLSVGSHSLSITNIPYYKAPNKTQGYNHKTYFFKKSTERNANKLHSFCCRVTGAECWVRHCGNAWCTCIACHPQNVHCISIRFLQHSKPSKQLWSFSNCTELQVMLFK